MKLITDPPLMEIDLPQELLRDRALADLARRGVKRLAVLFPSEEPPAMRQDAVREALRKFGLSTAPELLHYVDPMSPQFAESLVYLLFCDNNKVLPDALFVGDDNFLPHVIRGLVAALGETRARQLPLIAHGNWPLLQTPDFPIHYFLFDLVSTLRSALRMIDCFRLGIPIEIDPIDIIEQQL